MTIANRSLVNDRAMCPSADYPANEVQEHAPDRVNVRTLRSSLNTLGDGFIEAISSATIVDIANKQCKSSNGQVCGQVIQVPGRRSPRSNPRRPLRLEKSARQLAVLSPPTLT